MFCGEEEETDFWWEKILANHTSDKGVLSKIRKELSKLFKRENNNKQSD